MVYNNTETTPTQRNAMTKPHDTRSHATAWPRTPTNKNNSDLPKAVGTATGNTHTRYTDESAHYLCLMAALAMALQ
jgi:hypothetical protein